MMFRNNTGIKLVFIFLTVVILLLNRQFAIAADEHKADSLLSAGNHHYLNREFAKAVECYQQVIDQGYDAGELFYNLANAYYKQNNLPQAIRYYEKALLLDPGDEDIRQNLSMANARITDKIEDIPVFFLKRWFSSLSGILTPDQWAVLSLVVFVIALVAFTLYIISNRTGIKKLGFSLGVILALLSIVGLTLMHSRKMAILHSNAAIIMVSSQNVKSSPDEQSVNVFVLHEGTKVVVLDSVQNWKEIKIANGNKGWLPGEILGEI
jgi:tetratricopeptide (TPR) repeat protein